MRQLSLTVALCLATLSLPAMAAAQNGNGHVQAFGGLTAGGRTSAPTFGGSIAVPLGSHVQIFGEGGKMTDLTFTPIAELIDLTPADIRLSAYYGQAGVRVLGGSGNAVRPYGEVSVGMARLHTGVSGLGTPGNIIDGALHLVDRTEPILGLGAGLMLQGGPVVVDLGYRYKQIRGGDMVTQILTGGDLGINQLRVGVGVRF
jgi:opacity protein-like surface antigen